jgi:hypothetical protein
MTKLDTIENKIVTGAHLNLHIASLPASEQNRRSAGAIQN